MRRAAELHPPAPALIFPLTERGCCSADTRHASPSASSLPFILLFISWCPQIIPMYSGLITGRQALNSVISQDKRKQRRGESHLRTSGTAPRLERRALLSQLPQKESMGRRMVSLCQDVPQFMPWWWHTCSLLSSLLSWAPSLSCAWPPHCYKGVDLAQRWHQQL